MMVTTLPSGLDVVVARHPTVPLVELRLWIPFPWAPTAQAVLLAETILAGTEHLAGATGGSLTATVDADRLLLSGTAHAGALDALLALVARVVTSASYPDDHVARRRNLAAHTASVIKTLPEMRAFEAINHRLHGFHPYGLPSPAPEEIAAVTAEDLRRLHAERVRPRGTTLILIGDVGEDAVERADRALAGWTGTGGPTHLEATPGFVPKPVERIEDALVTQALLRIVLPSVRRDHPDYPALALANLVYGGYFSSRLVANLREDKGLCYAPRSEHVHVRATSLWLISVNTAHGEAALEEVLAELQKLPALTRDEVERARRYAIGAMLLRTSTQPGTASVLVDFVAQQLSLDLFGRPDALFASVTADEVAEAASRYLTPEKSLGVLLTPVRTGP